MVMVLLGGKTHSKLNDSVIAAQLTLPISDSIAPWLSCKTLSILPCLFLLNLTQL